MTVLRRSSIRPIGSMRDFASFSAVAPSIPQRIHRYSMSSKSAREYANFLAKDFNSVLTAEEILHLGGLYSGESEGDRAKVFVETADFLQSGFLKGCDLALKSGVFDMLTIH